MPRASTPTRLLVLTSLYVAQGLPFGFFGQCVPVLMRQSGASLLAVSASNLLALPWVLKLLWAPAFNHPRFATPRARRLSVLVLQLTAAALLVLGTPLDPYAAALPVFVLVVLSNLVSATQDIPTDAMTVEALAPGARGLGNGAQVAGYRVGMVVGGGYMLSVLDTQGWSTALGLLATALLATAVPLLVAGPLQPPDRAPGETPAEREAKAAGETPATMDAAKPPNAAGETPSSAAKAPPYFTAPGMATWFGVLVIYKLGTSFGTGSIRPMLVDWHYGLGDIGWMLGTLGSSAAIAGSVLGGFLTTRIPRPLPTFALLQAVALTSWVVTSELHDTPWLHGLVAGSVIAEHFTSGMATTALFTAMMNRCRPGLAASDYTTQASTVLIADGLVAIASGASAQALGYTGHLVFASLVAFAAVAATFRVRAD